MTEEADVVIHDIRERIRDINEAVNGLGDCCVGFMPIGGFARVTDGKSAKDIESLLRDAMQAIRDDAGDTESGAMPSTVCIVFIEDEVAESLQPMLREDQGFELTQEGEEAIEGEE